MRLAELATAAVKATDPAFTAASTARFGGVDPIGLRQINFDLMDEVLPGLNNVARHVRPFVLVAWAWRRAGQLARRRGDKFVRADELRNFVDRMEVLFVASQLIRDAAIDLPGNDYLRAFIEEPTIRFDGAEWKATRKHRRDSTSLSAAINYGPGLRALQWIAAHPDAPGVMVPTSIVEPALDAFEAAIVGCLDFDIFNTLDGTAINRKQLERLAEAWPLDRLTRPEKQVMGELLIGTTAPVSRQQSIQLMLLAAESCGNSSASRVREELAGAPAEFRPPNDLTDIAAAWRRVQVRQLFRLSLEALHYWLMVQLENEPRSMTWLVKAFLDQQPLPERSSSAEQWLRRLQSKSQGPTSLMDSVQESLADPALKHLVRNVSQGIAFCLREPSFEAEKFQPSERLPLLRARREVTARAQQPATELVRHILESWVLAQHAYWSVGRGLADARSGGKILLRLKVILDDGGWSLTPGARVGGPPVPTRDRLQTALSLAEECGLLK